MPKTATNELNISKPKSDSWAVRMVSAVRCILYPFFVMLGEISDLAWQALRIFLSRGLNMGDLLGQMATIGARSAPIVVLTTFTSAAVIALYFADFLIQYGAGDLTGAVVALSLGRELAPVLVGVVVAARAGSAIAAEIGTMKVTQQIDALRALAVSPIEYLIVPRLIACALVMPLLCVLADWSGLFGGYIVAIMQGVTSSSYPEAIQSYCVPRDFLMGIIKTVVFGIIIALIGCHQGMTTSRGATGVGRATTASVVISIVLIYITNFFMAYVMFNGKVG
jgi:phospholipid/cholesterol/gamma-HCH transport system permease protein